MSEERGRRSAAAAAADRVRAILEEAERETASQLHKVGESADRLAVKADEIERRLEALAAGVREAVGELREELRELRDTPPAEPPDASPGEPVTQGAAVAHREPVEEAEPVAEAEAVAAPEPESAEPEPEPASEPAPPASAPPGSEGARVIALNMALNGSSREETAAYLAENFELDDPDGLLDDVYSRAQS